MRQAIQTKWLSPTNTRPSRIVAKCEAKRIVVAWDHGLNVDDNHTEAAFELAKQLGWHGRWTGGAIPGSGYAFVLEGVEPSFTIRGA